MNFKKQTMLYLIAMICNTTQAVLFDLDGTLIDTAPDLHLALNTIITSYQHQPVTLSCVKPFVSHGVLAMLNGVLVDISSEKLSQYHQEILNYYAKNIKVLSRYFAGVEAMLASIEAQKIPWGIVTNKNEKFTNLLLTACNLTPGVVVSGDTCTQNKPHPEPLLFACSKLGVEAKNCLFVGDDIKDMQAGKNAGMTTVAVGYGYGKIDNTWDYDYLINHPKELLCYTIFKK